MPFLNDERSGTSCCSSNKACPSDGVAETGSIRLPEESSKANSFIESSVPFVESVTYLAVTLFVFSSQWNTEPSVSVSVAVVLFDESAKVIVKLRLSSSSYEPRKNLYWLILQSLPKSSVTGASEIIYSVSAACISPRS